MAHDTPLNLEQARSCGCDECRNALETVEEERSEERLLEDRNTENPKDNLLPLLASRAAEIRNNIFWLRIELLTWQAYAERLRQKPSENIPQRDLVYATKKVCETEEKVYEEEQVLAAVLAFTMVIEDEESES